VSSGRLSHETSPLNAKSKARPGIRLERLLDLFRISEVSSIAEPSDRAERIWLEILTLKGVASLFPKFLNFAPKLRTERGPFLVPIAKTGPIRLHHQCR